ncbi:MAG: porin family protein [Bacteroidia bacterium]
MKKIKTLFATAFLSFIISSAHSQVLISLLLGDKLNSDKLEFGLDGGVNWLNISNTPKAKQLFDWNLGFYFDFKLKEKLFIHTGVLVKSKMGTSGLDAYSVNNANVDSVFLGGSVDRKINYFNVPGLVRYRFYNYFHVEGGIQLGLRYTAFDNFKKTINSEDDLTFKYDTKDNYARLDAGGVAGLGYRFSKGKGMTLTVKYYYGFVDIDKVTSGSQYNSALYINASIPIGKGKAEKKAKEKEAEESQQKK